MVLLITSLPSTVGATEVNQPADPNAANSIIEENMTSNEKINKESTTRVEAPALEEVPAELVEDKPTTSVQDQEAPSQEMPQEAPNQEAPSQGQGTTPTVEEYRGNKLNDYIVADNYKFEPKGDSLTQFNLSFDFKTQDYIKAGDFITIEHSKALLLDSKASDLTLTYNNEKIIIAKASYDYANRQIRYEFTSDAEKFVQSTVKVEQGFKVNNKLIDNTKEVEIVNTILGYSETTDILLYGQVEMDPIIIEKVDENKAPISDAEFTIYDREDREVAKKVTDKDGKVEFDPLKEGSYILKETKISNEYEATDETWTIEVAANGTTVVQSSKDQSSNTMDTKAEKVLDNHLTKILDIADIKAEDVNDFPRLSSQVEKTNKVNLQGQITSIDWDNSLVEQTLILNPNKEVMEGQGTLSITNEGSHAILDPAYTSIAIYEVEEVQGDTGIKDKLVDITGKFEYGQFTQSGDLEKLQITIPQDMLKEKVLVVKIYTDIKKADADAATNTVELTASLQVAKDQVQIKEMEKTDIQASQDLVNELTITSIATKNPVEETATADSKETSTADSQVTKTEGEEGPQTEATPMEETIDKGNEFLIDTFALRSASTALVDNTSTDSLSTMSAESFTANDMLMSAMTATVKPMAITAGATNSVEIVKTNEDGSQRLSDATFEAYPISGGANGTVSTTPAYKAVSGTDGSAVFTGLKPSTFYRVRETSAPTGYYKTTQEWDVYIDAYGQGYIAAKGSLIYPGSVNVNETFGATPSGQLYTATNGMQNGVGYLSVDTANNTFTEIIYFNRGRNESYSSNLEISYNPASSSVTGIRTIEKYALTPGTSVYNGMPSNFNVNLSDTATYRYLGSESSLDFSVGDTTYLSNAPYIYKVTGTYDENSPYNLVTTLSYWGYVYVSGYYDYYGNWVDGYYSQVTSSYPQRMRASLNMTAKGKPPANSPNSVTATNSQTSLTFKRVDNKNVGLKGGSVAFYEDTNGDGVWDTKDLKVTDGVPTGNVDTISGIFSPDKLYFVKETAAPDGYLLNTTAYKFKINQDGTISWGQGTGSLSSTGTVILTSAPDLTKVRGSVTLNKQNSSGSPLSGAVFEIYTLDANKKPILSSKKTVATGQDGIALFNNLPADSYYLIKEVTPPRGYLVTSQTWDAYVDAAGNSYIAETGKLSTTTTAAKQETINTTLPSGTISTASNGTGIGLGTYTIDTVNNTITQYLYYNRDTDGAYTPVQKDAVLTYDIGNNSGITNITGIKVYELTQSANGYSTTYMPSNFNPLLTNTLFYKSPTYTVATSGLNTTKATITIPNVQSANYTNQFAYIIKVTSSYDEFSDKGLVSSLSYSGINKGTSYYNTGTNGTGKVTSTVNMTPATQASTPSSSTAIAINTPSTVSITRETADKKTVVGGAIEIWKDTNGNGIWDEDDNLVDTKDLTALPLTETGVYDGNATYFIKEVNPPLGFAANPNIYEFTVDSSGTVKWGLDKDSSLSKTGTIVMTAVPEQPKLVINKVDEMNQPLVGSSFRITSDTGYNKEIDGASLSRFEFTDLVPGNYKIEEIVTPDGYKDPKSYWVFKVEKDDAGVVSITTPDFPMEIKTDENVVMKGNFAPTYDSLFNDLVRNEDPYSKDIMSGSNKLGSISKRIISNEASNTYKVEIIVQAEAGKAISGGNINDAMGNNFNLDLGDDNIFAREDYSLTASDGSFYYIENDGSKEIKGVYGGTPFGNKILSGSNLTYNKANDSLSLTGIKVSDGQWIKLTYDVTFDTTKINEKNTFYWTNSTATFTASGVSSIALPRPAARPIIDNFLTKAEIAVINSKVDATLSIKKVGDVDGAISGLQGAQFELYKSDINDADTALTTKKIAVSNYEGIATFDNVQRDYKYSESQKSETFYWIREISAPSGYIPNKDLIGPFRVNYDGSLVYLNSMDGQNIISQDTGGMYNISNEKIKPKGELIINKKINDAEGTPLEGTSFTLYYTGEEDTSSTYNSAFWTSMDNPITSISDSTGKVHFGDLNQGYYRLEETIPTAGYVKSDTVYRVYIDSQGITSIAMVNKPQATTLAMFRSANTFVMSNFIAPMATTADSQPLGDTRSSIVSVQKIDSTSYKELYPTNALPRKSNAGAGGEYKYVTKNNNTGFAEQYKNPDYVTGLYQFDGMYKDKPFNNVAGGNKYVIPTGIPGEYEVHVKVSGNRIDSTTGVVIVYDNSNSMGDIDPNTGLSRIDAARNATETFVRNLVSTTSEETKVALVTYGSVLFDKTETGVQGYYDSYGTYRERNVIVDNDYSYYTFTNDPQKIIDQLPDSIPSDRYLPNLGGTYTQEAISKAQALLAADKTFENKVIITITDGVPTFSNLISYIDSSGNYVFTDTKTGTGNRFNDPYNKGSVAQSVDGNDKPLYYIVDGYGNATYDYENNLRLTTTTNNYPFNQNPSYRNYWVIDRTTVYDSNAPYASTTGTKYYMNGSTIASTTVGLPRVAGDYGYKLISNHGYATIDKGKQIKATGTQMYTIGIQLNDSNISGTTAFDAYRAQALEVMFGISSSKDSYFDAQNLDNLDEYLNVILQELANKNPPTVNAGILTDPMGDMVNLQSGSIKINDIGKNPIDGNVFSAIEDSVIPMTYTDSSGNTVNTEGIKLDNLNLSRDQAIELVYKVNLDTENPNYKEGTMYDTNGPTTLQPNGDYSTKWNLPIPAIKAPAVDMTIEKQWQTSTGATDTSSAKPITIMLQRKIVGSSDDTYKDVAGTTREITAPWTASFESLIPFDSEGYVYEYRVVEVNPDGSHSVFYEGNAFKRKIINRQITNIDMRNTPNQVDFIKKDSFDDTPLSEVSFQLRKDGKVYVDSDKNYSELRTDSKGKLNFVKLQPGRYELVETRELPGYKLPANPVKTFVVGIDGRIRQADTGLEIKDNPSTGEPDPFKTIYNTPTIVNVKLQKVDGDNNTILLQGAQFKLFMYDQETEVHPGTIYTSGPDGIINLGDLKTGQYYLQEIKSPNGGYQPVPGFMSLAVQTDGNVNFNGKVLPANEMHSVGNYKEKTTEIAVKKVKRNSDGSVDSISGATFKITDIDGNELNPQPGTYTNYHEGDDTVDRYGMYTRLTDGVYRIEEKMSPVGYMRFQGYYTFEVKSSINQDTGETTNSIIWIKKHSSQDDKEGILIYENGKIISPDDAIEVMGSDESTFTKAIGIQVFNEPNKLAFEKIDGATGAKLQNVDFGIYYEVDNYEEIIGYKSDGTAVKLRALIEGKMLDAKDPNSITPVVRTSDQNGLITFEGLPQRAPGMPQVKYYVKETKTLDGYQLEDKVFGPYIATEDGIIGPTGEIISSSQKLIPDPIQVKNYEKPELQLTKIDSKDKTTKLDGAEFELYKATTSSYNTYDPKETAKATGIKATTGADGDIGIAKFKDVEQGLYWLKETKAPKEYIKLLDFIGPFLVEDGKIYSVALDEQGKIIESQKLELVKDTSTGIYNYDVENVKAVYPATGGIGTVNFFLYGLLLMALGFIWMMKKKADDKYNCRI